MAKVLELLLNEGSGTTAVDTSGYDNNASIFGAKWRQLPTGKWVLDFNELDQATEWLRCAYSPSLDIQPGLNLSIEVWVSITKDKSAMWIGNGSGGASGGYALYYHQPIGQVCGYIEDWQAHVYCGTQLEVDNWYHIVYTYDGQYGQIFVKGVLMARSPEWTGGMLPTNDPFNVYTSFVGRIGYIGVYDHALTEIEVDAYYRASVEDYGEIHIPTELTTFVTPPISDQKILPLSLLPSEYVSSVISLDGSPGEYRPATFTVYTPTGISDLEVSSSDLVGPGTILSSNVDIRAVKCWYQAGVDIWVGAGKGKVLTPELLLKDDSLVKVENEENYLKLTSGEYVWISEVKSGTGREIISIEDLPVNDSATLQPVNIPAGTNKQFWVTVKIPDGTPAGVYTGKITLQNAIEGVIAELQLQLEVLPIELSKPYLTYSLYYRGRLDPSQPEGSISSEIKSEAQMRAELENMFNHGVTNPTVYQGYDETLLGTILTIRNEVGMSGQPLYYLGGYSTAAIAFFATSGVPDVYFYSIDEPSEANIAAVRAFCDAVHGEGAKVFVAVNTQTVVENLADVLDLANWSTPNATIATLYHNYGHKVFSYGNPQVGVEQPETYRRNYGLLLWQKGFDGAMDYAYQDSYCNIWNDFDDAAYRDHVFAYPTIDGVIDTIQWEGWREGVTDVRYLTTLLDTIATAKAGGIDTTVAENYLVGLKTASLSDLDQIRVDIINHIISLQGQPVPPPCTTGETECVGYDLYTCNSANEWELTKSNAEQCGYVPPPPPTSKAWLIGGALLAVIAAVAVAKKGGKK